MDEKESMDKGRESMLREEESIEDILTSIRRLVYEREEMAGSPKKSSESSTGRSSPSSSPSSAWRETSTTASSPFPSLSSLEAGWDASESHEIPVDLREGSVLNLTRPILELSEKAGYDTDHYDTKERSFFSNPTNPTNTTNTSYASSTIEDKRPEDFFPPPQDPQPESPLSSLFSSKGMGDAVQAFSSFLQFLQIGSPPSESKPLGSQQNTPFSQHAETSPAFTASPSASDASSSHPTLENLVAQWMKPLLIQEVQRYTTSHLEGVLHTLIKPLAEKCIADYIQNLLPQLVRVWLDQNLASIVVRCVESQIQAIQKEASQRRT